jgi:hypothetical protein
MELAEPLMAGGGRSRSDASPSAGRWYDPDSATFIDDGGRESRPATADRPAGGTYSPVNRGGRFSMKAAMPSA